MTETTTSAEMKTISAVTATVITKTTAVIIIIQFNSYLFACQLTQGPITK
jgi:hypothetical protein